MLGCVWEGAAGIPFPTISGWGQGSHGPQGNEQRSKQRHSYGLTHGVTGQARHRVELGFLSEACVDFQDAINSWGRKAQGNVVWDVDQSW